MSKRRFRATTQRDRSHPVAKDLLKQNFSSNAPNRRWAGDITYISTREGWLYLAVVMDLYSRRIVGWSMSRWMSRRLVLAALRMAIDARQPEGSLIHHSDRGGQYTSDDFGDELAKHGIESSRNCGACPGLDPGITPVLRAFSACSSKNGGTVYSIERGTKRGPTYSITSGCSIPENVAIVTLATSARMTSNSSQPDLFELSTKTGQNHTSGSGFPRLFGAPIAEGVEKVGFSCVFRVRFYL